MDLNKHYTLGKDFIISLTIVGIFSFFLLQKGFLPQVSSKELSLFIPTFVSIMGILAAILTILFAFEDNFSNNEIVKVLKNRGLYSQIYERFIDSTVGILYSSIILVGIYVFLGAALVQNNLIWVSILYYIVVFFSFLRIYRAFFVFRKMQKVVSQK